MITAVHRHGGLGQSSYPNKLLLPSLHDGVIHVNGASSFTQVTAHSNNQMQ